MNLNHKMTITDEQRQQLASHIAGKPVKRLATRKDICAFLDGCLQATFEISDSPAPAQPAASPPRRAPQLSADEESEIQRLRKEGKSDNYIRGWIQVGRRLHK